MVKESMVVKEVIVLKRPLSWPQGICPCCTLSPVTQLIQDPRPRLNLWVQAC